MSQNKFTAIDDKCYKLKKLPNNCLHFALENYESKYTIYYDFQIKQYTDDPHFVDATKPSNIECGNLWNVATQKERNFILSNEPIIDYPVRRFRGCANNKLNKNVSLDDSANELVDYIESDCWQVYYKNPTTGFPVEVLVDSRKSILIKNDNDRTLEEQADDLMRDMISNHPNHYLKESLNNDLILCVIMGGFENCIDVCFHPDKQSNTFDIITCNYTRNN